MSNFLKSLKNLFTSEFNKISSSRATETQYGFARKANNDEVINGVSSNNDSTFVTPETLKNKMDALPDFSAALEVANAYKAADTQIISDYKTADTQIISDYKAADTQIISDYKAADTQIISDYKTADAQLKKDMYDEIAGSGQEGEILTVKYNNSTSRNELTSVPLINFINITTNQEELDAQKLEPVGMQEIFNTWYRFSHWYGEQNLSGNTGHQMNATPSGAPNNWSGQEHAIMRNNWSYDPSTGMILSGRNSPVYSAFIHPRKLSNWYLKVLMDGAGDGDNDGILICCAYMKDSNGVEHTIDLCRAVMGVGNVVYLNNVAPYNWGMDYHWSLVYDYRKNTQKELANNPYIQSIPNMGWSWNKCYMSCKRTMSTLTCYTSQFNGTDIDQNSKIEFSLPSSKPADWSDEMWANMNIMLGSAAQMGVGVHSQNGRFTILEQKYIFADQKIYDMLNDAIWEYKEATGVWTNLGKVSTLLTDGLLYFNRKTSKLLYYTNGSIVQLN